MLFRVFTLHPDIFRSFAANSLIARGLSKGVIALEQVNWRQEYGLGKRKDVDAKPYGGGSGMVLQAEPIYQALSARQALSPLYRPPDAPLTYRKLYPNNADFFNYVQARPVHKRVTISLTPRGFPYTQQTAEWLAARFETVNLVCGRYEGFDARADGCFDLELSLGNFVLNGGEVAAMALIESIARLVPGFVTKDTSILHDSFSKSGNYYHETHEYVIGTRRLRQKPSLGALPVRNSPTRNLFDNDAWLTRIAPQLEHPHFTRPEVWQNQTIPPVLLEGNHAKIQAWRSNWLQQSLSNQP